MTSHLSIESESVSEEVGRLLRLAWPVVVGQLGIMAMGTVDVFMVGQLSDGGAALASIGLGNTWSFMFLIFGLGTVSGLDPLLAQANGAGDRSAFQGHLAHGAWLALLVALPIMLMHLLAGPSLTLMGQPEDVVPLAARYSAILALGILPVMMFSLFRTALQARGVMRPAMYVILFANLLNVGGNQLFIHGIGDWPGLGPVGVAWSTVLVRVFTGLAILAFARRELQDLSAGLSEGLQRDRVRRVAEISLPVGLHSGLEVWAFSAATLMMGWFGQVALAAHQVALTLASVSFMVPLGISSAAATRVGNLMGARRPVHRAAWTSIAMGAGVMSVSALVFLSVPHALAALFVPNQPQTLALAASLLPIAGVFQLSDGTQAVSFGVLRGAGDTKIPAAANLIGYYLLGLPIGGLLATLGGIGPKGIWYGLVIGLTAVALILISRLRGLIQRYESALD